MPLIPVSLCTANDKRNHDSFVKKVKTRQVPESTNCLSRRKEGDFGMNGAVLPCVSLPSSLIRWLFRKSYPNEPRVEGGRMGQFLLAKISLTR